MTDCCNIFHIADAATWAAAQAEGAYNESTLDKSLAEEGFIHCSYEHQVDGVLERYYAGVTTPLVKLTIDPDKLMHHWQEDDGFPHIYGPLNPDAVIAVDPING